MAKVRLARPATALIVMASTQSVFASIILVCGIVDLLARPASVTEKLPLFIAFCQFGSLLFIAVGAAKMGFLESYNLGRMAAILACVPMVSPFVIVGIPFGVWSLRLLSEPEIQHAFQTNANREKPA